MWVATLIGFTIYQMAPGGPLQFLDNDPRRSEADINRLRHLYGLDRSVVVQYVAWVAGEDWFGGVEGLRDLQSGRCAADPDKCVRGVLRLDFGRSFHYQGEPVLKLIAERIPATLLLAVSSLILSVIIGIPLGIVAAFHRGRWPDHVIRVTTVLLSTVPEWWIGLLLLIILGSYLRIVLLGGMQSIGGGDLPDLLHHLALPATGRAIGGWIGFSQDPLRDAGGLEPGLRADRPRQGALSSPGDPPARPAQRSDAVRHRPGGHLLAHPLRLGVIRDRLLLARDGPPGHRIDQQS
jgi:peptide/nickel transport system permease protein